MTSSERLIKAAIETLVHEGRSLEDAQVSVLMTLSKIAASSGPKNLQRLVAENRATLIAGRIDADFEVSDDMRAGTTYLPVPKTTIAAARGWLLGTDNNADERFIANELWHILYPEDKPN